MREPLRIADRVIGPGHPPYVIAELGVNHDGSLELAMRLVDAAAAAGADAIKLQWFEARALLSRDATLAAYQTKAGARDPVQMLETLELDRTAMATLVEHATHRGLHALVTVFSPGHVAAAATLPWAAFKTASPDLVNRPLLTTLLGTGRPLIVSTGAASREEVLDAVRWLGDHPAAFMQCVSAYPTPDDQASLGGMAALRTACPGPVGYSDHTTALDTGALAVAAGATLLEKHVTLDRQATGPDHAASVDPSGLAEYVRLVRRAWTMLGLPTKRVLPIEDDVRRVSRQSIVAARPLSAGHELVETDLLIKRPGTGLAPDRLEAVLGRRLARAVVADAPLREEDLA